MSRKENNSGDLFWPFFLIFLAVVIGVLLRAGQIQGEVMSPLIEKNLSERIDCDELLEDLEPCGLEIKCKKEFVWVTKKIVVEIGMTTGPGLTFPLDAEILCEEGLRIEEYPGLNEKVIYACLESTPENLCPGFGKICLVKIKEEVCKVK